ncbi:MAG: phytoene dehydrogenase-like protein [Cyclobacteriaceae bacterium]|jgi:phytoene dehydrogenase-like protein
MIYDVAVVGSGMGALSAAVLLAKENLNVIIIEQNWQPGGCTSSYWRKGFVFESGATTLVGLDKNMPLKYLMDKTGIKISPRKLVLPMQVHLANGKKLNRYEKIDDWITEVSRHFGGNQKAFWHKCFEISQFVWQASTKYLHFPPSKISDLFQLAKNASIKDLFYAKYALISTEDMLKKYGLDDPEFRKFIDEQLLITAQNPANEVNFLFGAAALCYTNYGNYYMDGGLLNLINPLIDYVKAHNGEIFFREKVMMIKNESSHFKITTSKNEFKAKKVISGIPFNQTSNLIESNQQEKMLSSEHLYSAFQLGIGFKSTKIFDTIHYQIHLRKPLPGCGAKSFFVSLNHPEDKSRSDIDGARVASVSTHISDPENTVFDGQVVEDAILEILEEKGFFKKSDILYKHHSTQKSWNKWTNRVYGSVGGYPQFMKIKPWQMIETRIQKGIYQCGDTSYPGQGIPGATLSGIIAAEKLKSDLNLK